MSEPISAARVSVVIPFHGDPAPTVRLIEQLLGQRPAAPHEIIVADDASPVAFPSGEGWVVLRRTRNGGFGSAVNTGAAGATGELLLILNSDLTVGPGFVAEFVAAAAPWQPAVASPGLDEPGRPNAAARLWPRCRHHVAAWLAPLARLHENRRLGWLQGHDTRACAATTAVVTDWVVGAALLVPRGEFMAVGGFDEDFFMNSEEIDLQRRLQQRQVRAVYLPTVRVGHVGGGSTERQSRRLWLVEGWMRYQRKWGRPRALRWALIAASYANYGWHRLRMLRGMDVDARATLAAELGVIRAAWQRASRGAQE